jgi:hypothetical protein
MKAWHYHLLSLATGLVVLAMVGVLLPIAFFIFVLFGYHIAALTTAYILGRIVLSYSLPGTYRKIQENGCQAPDNVA